MNITLLKTFVRKMFAINFVVKAIVSVVVLIAISIQVASFVLPQPHQAQAAINLQINYQGKLTNTSDVAVANGDYNMEFILYDAPSGGTNLWTETRTGGNKVTVTNGLFSVMLGSVTSLASVDFNQTVYLGVNIGGTGTPSWDGEMTPRKIVGSVPSAFLANGVVGTGGVRNTIDSATALTIAKSGTNYALQVDTSAGSAATGLKVTSNAASSGLALAVISSGSNENLTLDAKGSGTITLGGTSTGNLILGGSSGDILLGGGSGSTGCTVTNSTGAFACTAGGSFTTLGLTGAVSGGTSFTGSTFVKAPYIYGGDMTTTYGGYTGGVFGSTTTHAVLDFVDNGSRIGEFYTTSSTFNFFTDVGKALNFYTNADYGGAPAFGIDTSHQVILSSLDTDITAPTTSGTTKMVITDGNGQLSFASGSVPTGTNTGDVTLAAFGSSANANGASLTGQALTLQPASASFPGGVSTTTQSFAGDKTFVNNTTFTGTTTQNNTATFNTDVDLVFAGTENLALTSTITSTTSVDLFSTTVTNQTSSGTQRGIVLTNANDAANAVTENLILIDNAETTASTLTDAILITSSGVNDGITDAIDASASNITNAINIGANAIAGTNFSVTGAGAVTAVGVNAGAGSLQGTGGLTLTGAVSITNNGSSTVDINTGTSSGLVTIGGGSGTFSLQTTNIDISSAGAITGATGITSSGTITFSGLGGGGTQCLQTSNTGVISGTGSACGAGSITWNSIANPTGTQSLTFDDGELNSWTVSSDTEVFQTITANSLTTGKLLSASSSSLSSGTLIDLAVTGTAAASNTQTVLNISTSGANANSSQTTYGAQFANTHSGTSSTNIAAYFTASGGTDNYAIIVPSTGGNSGFGTATPTNLSGTGSYFGNNQVNPVWVSANDPSKVTALVVQGNLGQAVQFIDQTGTAKADFGYYSSEIYIVNRAGGGTRFYNNATNVAMFLDSNANLGLGTSTSAPASRLEVKGASGQLSTLIGDAGYGTGYAGISVNGTFASNSYTLLGDASNLMINRPSGGDMYFREGNTTQMILKTSTGNLGIGDTSPAALLTVGSGDLFQVASNGNLTSSNAGTWTFSNDTNIVLSGGLNGLAFDTDVLSIDATSNRVGFGTTSPSYPVDVVGTARATDFIAANTVTSQDYLYAGQLRVHGTGGSGEVQLWSNSNQRLTVLSSGEIGIGDTSPAALLTVGSGDLFQVNSSGNLIFNQTSPTISIGNTGSLVFNDGSNTLCTIADTGSTGNLSCTGNITGASTGTVGYWSRSGTLISPATSGDSLSVPGAGANSEKFGDSSLAAGARASAFGKSASGAGDDSTAIGYASSASSTNATAIGASATADGNSTAIGKSTTATGTANIAIGSGASATTGTQMTVIGGTSTGSNGVLIGKNSTGGHYGVGIGVDITLSGSESIAIGNLTVNAYTNSIALGRGATTTANNQMVVGAGSYAVSDIYFGKGVTNATPTAYTINGTGGSGTDIAGAAINIAGGKGTGAGVGGNIVFQYAPASGSGSSLNSLQTACSISGTNGSLSCPGVGSSSERFGASSAAAGNNSLAVGNNSSAAGAQSIAIGKGASAQYAGSISIGYNATQTNAVADNYGIAIGYSASSDYTAVALGGIAVSSGNQNVAVGYDAQANGPYQSTALGGGARANATWGAATAVGWAADAVGSASVALGSSSTSAGYSVVIGMAASAGNSSSNLFNIAIGQSATISSSYSGTIVMGAQSAATGNAQFIAGSSNYPINDIYFGKGATNATATAYTINGTGGSGTNIAGADLIFAGGKGTGNSAGGDILFKTSDAGVSGATLQSLTTKMILTELGYLGVGVSVPTHNLDVANGISIRNGNPSATYTSNQIVMSYAGSDSYRHAINTRHDSSSQAGNAIDFLLWDYGTDSAGTTGTKRVMTLHGDGNVGINITTPTARLQSNSSAGVAPLLLRYDSGGGYFDLLKATYNGGGYSEISSTQPIQVSATGSMVLSTSSGYVRVQDGTSGGSIRLVTAGNVETLQMTSAGVIQTLNSSNLTIGTNSTSAVTIDTSQRVGIGDTSPAALLTVGSGDLFQVASNGNLTSSNAGTWTFSNDTNFALSGGVNGLAFDTNTFSVDASNNRIGLGTTSPSYQLDIRGGVENNAIYADTSSAQTALNIVGGDTNGYYPTLSLCPLANCNVGGGSIQGYDGISIVTRGYIRMMNESAYTNTVKDFLSIEHQTTGTPANGLGSAILFRLESSTTANLDSGRISNYWTDVTHATRTSNLGFSTVNSGGSLTEKMTLQGNGNFGIGTTGPSAMLHVVKSDNGTDEIAKFFANNLTQGIGINYNSILAIGSNTNQNISITPKGSGDIILTSGRTGVAYTPTSGTAALMVNGAAAVGSSTYLNASAPTNGLIVEGNVGIGASSLGSKLQVNADASGIGLIVRANATTPGDLTQWHNSSGLVLAKVTSAGVLEVGSSSAANDGRINVRASNNTIAGYLTVGGGGANELEIQAYDTLTLGASNASLLTVKPTDPVDWRVYSGNTLTLGGYTGFGGEVVMKNLQDSSEVFHAYLAGTQMVTFPNGNVGIGDTSPAALLTVGSGDLFQVNSSGAIAAATGVTSSGTITFSGLGGGGTQCVNVSNTGVLGTTTCGGALTPWTSDIDADGYDLNDLSNILFRETTGAPTSTDVGLFRDNSGDLNLNVLSGKTFNVQVAGTDEYNFSSSALAMNSNNITGVGTAITATAGLAVTATSANLALVTATSGNITLAPASTGSVQITSGVATGTTTASGMSLVANSLTTGTGLYLASSSLSSGSLIDLQISGTAGASSQKGINVATTGTITGTQTTYGGYFANTHSGGTSTNIGLYSTATGGTNNYAAIFQAGNVGIGTTTPLINLHVVTSGITSGLGTTPADRGFAISGGTGSSRIYMESTTATSGQRVFLLDNNAGILSFNSLNDAGSSFVTQNILTMLYSGNVGIGTSGPDRKLDVLDASNPQLRLTQADGTVYGDLQSTTTANLIITGDSLTSSSAKEYGLQISPTINQTSTASYTALDINVTETAATTANNLNRLADFKVGGSSKLAIANNGAITLQNAASLTTAYGGFGKFENHLTKSEEFDHANWTKSSVTAPTANTQVAPDGSTTAESLATSGSGGYVQQDTSTAVSSTDYTFSVWVKSTGTQSFSMRIDGTSSGTGTEITHTATTSWQRFSVTQAVGSFTGNVRVRIYPGTSASTGTVYAWGAQLEKSSVPNTYAKTTTAGLTNDTSRGLIVNNNMLNTTASGYVYGGRQINTIDSTTAGTHIGQFIRMLDNTSLDSGQNVRGLEVQAYSGTNVNGTNTGIASYGYTFGLQATTTAQAAAQVAPAAIFADLDNGTDGTTKARGNAIRAYTDNATSADLVYLYTESSAYTGNALLMDIGNVGTGSGSFASGNFISLKNAGTSKYTISSAGRHDLFATDADNIIPLYINTEESTVTQSVFSIESDTTGNGQSADTVKAHFEADGSLFISLPGTQNTTALCHATGGQANNDEIVDCSGAPSDVAEYFGSEDPTLEAGEIVVVGKNATELHLDGYHTSKAWVARSTGAYQDTLMGVISTAPAAVYGDEIFSASENPRPVALVGRVPVKVNLENGPIKAGDFITSSSTPGVGMKATKSGPVIGQALDKYDGINEIGTIIVFIKPTNYNGAEIDDQLAGLQFDYSNTPEGLANSAENSETILEYLLTQLPNLDTENLNQVNTDIVIAGGEIITPTVTTQTLRTDFLSSATSDGGLEVASTTMFNGGLLVDSISSISGLLTFSSDIEFFGTPYFTSDTAGFAVIKAGVQTVDVLFAREYLAQPIVNASFAFEQDADLSSITDSQALAAMQAAQIASAQAFLGEGVTFAITNKTKKGFTIVLNKVATTDVKFSWTALAVRNATTFMSIDPAPVISQEIVEPPVGDDAPTEPETPPVIEPDPAP